MRPLGEHALLDGGGDAAAAPDGVDRAQVVLVAAGHRHAALHVDAERRAVEGALDVVRGHGVAAEQHVDVAGLDEARELLGGAGVHHRRARRRRSSACRRRVRARSSLATSWMICALGFSLETAEAMNSKGWLSRGRSSGSTRMPWWPTTYSSPARTSLSGTARSTATASLRRSTPHAAVHLGLRDPHPLAVEAHERLEVGRGVEAVGKDAVGRRSLASRRLRAHRHGAVLLDRREQLLEVVAVAPEDAQDGHRGVGLGAPHVERRGSRTRPRDP